mmetsp:Transcript_6060/g.14753  ORF Transcript_6060/g.14753 Transcript_6060/m.14753 type:complete len:188 (-) Transcript_6060:1103-1666(-)
MSDVPENKKEEGGGEVSQSPSSLIKRQTDALLEGTESPNRVLNTVLFVISVLLIIAIFVLLVYLGSHRWAEEEQHDSENEKMEKWERENALLESSADWPLGSSHRSGPSALFSSTWLSTRQPSKREQAKNKKPSLAPQSTTDAEGGAVPSSEEKHDGEREMETEKEPNCCAKDEDDTRNGWRVLQNI